MAGTTMRSRNAFRPAFEALEERTVLNATALFSGGVVTITGDNKANTVVISDAGNKGADPRLTVTVNGQPALDVDARTVSAINFQMGKKNDVVEYNLTNSLDGLSAPAGTLVTRTITGNLGKGNDVFTASAAKYVAYKDAQMSLNVQGDKGKDAMTLNYEADVYEGKFFCVFDGGHDNDKMTINAVSSPNYDSAGVDVELNSLVDIRMLGGKGKDAIAMAYAGNVNSPVNFLADGGQDKDTISAAFTLNPNSGKYNPGSLTARVLGGSGKDALSLAVINLSPFPNLTISAAVEGGPQNDTLSTAGSNVPVTVTQ